MDANSIIGKITNKGIEAYRSYFTNYIESDTDGIIISIMESDRRKINIAVGQIKSYYRDKAHMIRQLPEKPDGCEIATSFDSMTVIRSYQLPKDTRIIVDEGDKVVRGENLAEGKFINKIFYIDIAKLLLTLLFIFLMFMVYWAGIRKKW